MTFALVTCHVSSHDPRLRWFCAMEAFAAASGAWHDYFKSYTWQPLETACAFFRLPHDQVAKRLYAMPEGPAMTEDTLCL